MLVSFSVENFRSFKKEATLNFVATDEKKMRDSHVFTPKLKEGAKPFDLVRSSVLYGQNAGGKSNFFKALGIMEGIVRYSMRGFETLPIIPFVLNQKTRTAPSTFEVVMIIDEVRYQYGFSATHERIHDEWLLAFPQDTQQTWFERTYDKETDEYRYTFGKFLEGQKKVWQETTSSKALFLSTAVQLNSTQLQPIYDWFAKKVHFIGIEDIPPHFYLERFKKHDSEKILDFLKAADFAIEGIEYEGTDNHYSLEMIHKTEEGGTVKMNLDEESDGTQRMFTLAPPFLEMLEKGRILVVDELNQRLHPYLMRYLIELVNNSEKNPNNAQLIFTTHAVSLLKDDIFRRDQIWFCERDKNQASTLFTLAEFEEGKGYEDFEAHYMTGRYGAVPFIGDFSNTIDKKADE